MKLTYVNAVFNMTDCGYQYIFHYSTTYTTHLHLTSTRNLVMSQHRIESYSWFFNFNFGWTKWHRDGVELFNRLIHWKFSDNYCFYIFIHSFSSWELRGSKRERESISVVNAHYSCYSNISSARTAATMLSRNNLNSSSKQRITITLSRESTILIVFLLSVSCNPNRSNWSGGIRVILLRLYCTNRDITNSRKKERFCVCVGRCLLTVVTFYIYTTYEDTNMRIDIFDIIINIYLLLFDILKLAFKGLSDK